MTTHDRCTLTHNDGGRHCPERPCSRKTFGLTTGLLVENRVYWKRLSTVAVVLSVIACCAASHATAAGPAMPHPVTGTAGVTCAGPLPPPQQPLPQPGLVSRMVSPLAQGLDRSVTALTSLVALPFAALDRLIERCCPATRPAGMGAPGPARYPSPGQSCSPHLPR